MRLAATRWGSTIYELVSGDEPKSSALALNKKLKVRLKTVARQNYPFPKFTAGKVFERPVHLFTQICAIYMVMQVLLIQDVAVTGYAFV